MTVRPIPPAMIDKLVPMQRPLPVILAELMLAEAELKRLNARFYAQGNTASEIDEYRSAALDVKALDLADEAKAAIEGLTGVSWDNIYEAMA